MGGKHSRTKGLNYERELVKEFRKLFPDVSRAIIGSRLDNNGVDLNIPNSKLRVQAKRNKSYAPISKIEEVKLEGIPALVTRGDSKRSVICLYLDDFIKIAQDIGELYE